MVPYGSASIVFSVLIQASCSNGRIFAAFVGIQQGRISGGRIKVAGGIVIQGAVSVGGIAIAGGIGAVFVGYGVSPPPQ